MALTDEQREVLARILERRECPVPELRIVHAHPRRATFLVLACNRKHYELWCRRNHLQSQGGNVHYLHDQQQIRGAEYELVILQGAYDPGAFDPGFIALARQRASQVHEEGVGDPIVTGNGQLVAWHL